VDLYHPWATSYWHYRDQALIESHLDSPVDTYGWYCRPRLERQCVEPTQYAYTLNEDLLFAGDATHLSEQVYRDLARISRWDCLNPERRPFARLNLLLSAAAQRGEQPTLWVRSPSRGDGRAVLRELDDGWRQRLNTTKIPGTGYTLRRWICDPPEPPYAGRMRQRRADVLAKEYANLSKRLSGIHGERR